MSSGRYGAPMMLEMRRQKLSSQCGYGVFVHRL
jgi:hypothetical protein